METHAAPSDTGHNNLISAIQASLNQRDSLYHKHHSCSSGRWGGGASLQLQVGTMWSCDLRLTCRINLNIFQLPVKWPDRRWPGEKNPRNTVRHLYCWHTHRHTYCWHHSDLTHHLSIDPWPQRSLSPTLSVPWSPDPRSLFSCDPAVPLNASSTCLIKLGGSQKLTLFINYTG